MRRGQDRRQSAQSEPCHFSSGPPAAAGTNGVSHRPLLQGAVHERVDLGAAARVLQAAGHSASSRAARALLDTVLARDSDDLRISTSSAAALRIPRRLQQFGALLP